VVVLRDRAVPLHTVFRTHCPTRGHVWKAIGIDVTKQWLIGYRIVVFLERMMVVKAFAKQIPATSGSDNPRLQRYVPK
jgi:hypothetical protein